MFPIVGNEEAKTPAQGMAHGKMKAHASRVRTIEPALLQISVSSMFLLTIRVALFQNAFHGVVESCFICCLLWAVAVCARSI